MYSRKSWDSNEKDKKSAPQNANTPPGPGGRTRVGGKSAPRRICGADYTDRLRAAGFERNAR